MAQSQQELVSGSHKPLQRGSGLAQGWDWRRGGGEESAFLQGPHGPAPGNLSLHPDTLGFFLFLKYAKILEQP